MPIFFSFFSIQAHFQASLYASDLVSFWIHTVIVFSTLSLTLSSALPTVHKPHSSAPYQGLLKEPCLWMPWALRLLETFFFLFSQPFVDLWARCCWQSILTIFLKCSRTFFCGNMSSPKKSLKHNTNYEILALTYAFSQLALTAYINLSLLIYIPPCNLVASILYHVSYFFSVSGEICPPRFLFLSPQKSCLSSNA